MPSRLDQAATRARNFKRKMARDRANALAALVPERIERLVGGPYLELFARTKRPGWTVWGNETDKFEAVA